MTGAEIDLQVQRYLSDLKRRGYIVNMHIAIAVREGILSGCVTVNGGGIHLTKDWQSTFFKDDDKSKD